LLIADGTNFNPTAVTALNEISTVANDDVFLAIDTSGGGLKKISRSAVVAGLATSSAISNVVDDDSPQLGADLDTNSFNIAFDDAHGINDDSGNEFIIFQKTATAVNQIDITNAATGNAPELSATGGDSNVSLKLTPKGTGQVVLDGNVGIESGLIDLKNAGSVSALRLYCESSNAHYAALVAPAHSDFSGNVTLTLPVTTSTLVGDTVTQTLTNKTLTSPVLNTGVSGTAVLDEDNLASDSATKLATQQSIKAYVDNSMTSAVTASSTTTLTNKTLTAPKFVDAGFIADANGNEQVVFQTTASAVNALEVTNSATGNAIVVGAFGSDSNVDIDLTPKGTGEINIAAGNLNYAGTAITSTGAELNILDGVTSTAAELNILDGVTSTAAELNILDGVTSTAAEINLIDGDTARGTTAVASGDGILINDAGTMRMTNVDTVSTYFAGHSVGGTNIVTTGALNAGSITSGFGNIDTGSSTITTTGLISGGSLDIDNVLINGTTIGHTDDTDLMTLANGVLTVAGEVSMTTLDIGGTNVTSTAAELNILDGVTSTAAELNILDGVTATTAELNYNDITTLGTSEASKVVTADANGVVTFDNGKIEESTAISSSSNAATLNLRLGDNFTHTLSENVTYTFSNPAANGKVSAFTLKVTQDSSARAITWPNSVDWAAGTAPTLSTGNAAVDVFVFATYDGGTIYYGFTAGQAMA